MQKASTHQWWTSGTFFQSVHSSHKWMKNNGAIKVWMSLWFIHLFITWLFVKHLIGWTHNTYIYCDFVWLLYVSNQTNRESRR